MCNKSLLRSTMYVGGTSPAKMLLGMFCEEDALVYDLEDAVSAEEKDAARFLVYNALKHQRPEDKFVAVRINGIYSKEFEEDLEAMVRAQPDAIRVPKIETAEEVQMIDAKITAIEKEADLPIGGIQLWGLIESYAGVMHVMEIAAASPRLTCLGFGAEDYVVSMGGKRSKEGWELFYARSAIVLACRSAGILAHDSAYLDINNLDGLEKELELARNLGFDGKSCIHPKQLSMTNACFTPSTKEIVYAKRIIEALKNASGVCVLDGAMIDKPLELRARNTLEKAKAAGIDIGGI